jgi:hypothetical protein
MRSRVVRAHQKFSIAPTDVGERPSWKEQMGKTVAQGKIEIRDFGNRPAVIQSFELLGLDEKVNECSSSEFRS